MPRKAVVDYSTVHNEAPRSNRFEVIAPRRTPPGETPRQKFVRLVASRTEGLLDSFNNLRKLANKESYPYGEADIVAICRLVHEQAEITERSFRSGREIPGGLRLSPDWEG